MRWKIVLEGTDEFGSTHRSELEIDKDVERPSAGEIGFSVEDGKAIMAHLQQVVVNQQCEAYVLTSRFCMDCEGFRRVKDYSKRKIRTVFGCIEVRNPRSMNCQRCLPHFCAARTVLRDIYPDQATPELMERSARLGSLLPYRKAAEVMAEFLPIQSTESFVTLRRRTMKLGQRLDERARERAWFEPASTAERRQMELNLPNDPEREFVVSIDTAHVRASRTEAGRNFEIVVARCGRGEGGSRPGRYFTTADTSKHELQSLTLQALQTEGYMGRGEVMVLSDGAEIMKRLPKALPQPTTHIIDWFHIAMKIQPLQQIADHIVRWRDAGNSEMAHVDADVRSLKWRLWHGQTDRALDQLETMTSDLEKLRGRGNLSATRLLHLSQTLSTYVRSNKSAIVNYGARYRSGRRIATALAESAVNSLVARRMVKKHRCHGQSGPPIFCFRFGPPFSTAIFGSASHTSRRNKPIDRGSRGCFEPTPPLLKTA
jgi:hypothetical protein